MTKADERTVDRWLVSDRVLMKGADDFSEQPTSIGILGAYITRVESADELRKGRLGECARQLGEEIIDVGSRPVTPGWVNGHTHLAMAPLRGVTSLSRRLRNVVSETFFAVEQHLLPADVRAFSRLGALESMLMGVGSVWDHYYFGLEVARALSEAGLTGCVAPTLQDQAGPGRDRSEEELESALAIFADERWRQSGISSALGPHASDSVSDSLFERVRAHALDKGLPVHLHLAQSFEEEEAGEGRFEGGIARGVAARLDGAKVLMAHGLFLDESDCRALVGRDWVLSYCPLSQLQFGVLSPFSAWLLQGGKWVLGTDCVASNDALDVQRELPIVGGEAALCASFSRARKEGTRARTLKAARAIETTRRRLAGEVDIAEPRRLLEAAWGFPLAALTQIPAGIAVGALANLLVLDPDHPALFPGDDLCRTLAYGSTNGAIEFCIAAGKPVGRDAGLTREIVQSEIYQETLTEVRRRRAELFGRARMGAG